MGQTSASRNRMLLYVDIIVLGAAALALVSAVHNAYYAGFYEAGLPAAADARATWTVIDVGVLALTLAWFLGRFYRARVREITKSY